MNKVAKRNTLFTSIHCEEVIYSKQYCLWNWSLFENGTVSAQNTVIAVNCRWEQDIQSTDIDKTRNLLYTWRKLQKDTISLWAFIVKRVFILNSIAFKTGHSLKWYSQCTKTVIAVNCRWEQDIQSKDIDKTRTLLYTWRKLKKKHFVWKHSLRRECLF